MICARLMVFKVSTLLLSSLIVFALGEQQVNQTCVLTNGTTGRCIRVKECPKMVELQTRDVLYQTQIRMIRNMLDVCGTGEDSSDPFVCCESPELSPERRSVLTTATNTTADLTPTPSKYDRFKDVLPQHCGVQNRLESIVFGMDDSYNHMWTVYMEITKRNINSKQRCVGTLIQESFVLTAAHCLHGLSIENVKLFFGVNNISHLEQCLAVGDCQEYTAAEFIIHPDYNSYVRSNDIALIRLSEPVDEEEIVPACLPIDYDFHANNGLALFVAWRDSEEGLKDLKFIRIVKEISQTEYGGYLKQRGRFNAPMAASVMFTVDYIGDQDICEVVSGASILRLRGEQYFVVGVYSFGPTCGVRFSPSVHTRVTDYLDWILDNLKESQSRAMDGI